jgi:formylglycine-generating enzyme required for sulfatase activity
VPGQTRIRMLATEVTQELYQRVMNDNPSRVQGPQHPVESVSWHDAQEFCRRLGWVLGARVRLPTEREFLAALEPGAEPTGEAGHPVPVSLRPATPAGFHGLDGNVAEWLLPASESEETAPVAGGSFLGRAGQGAAALVPTSKRERARHIGFRVVVEAE